MFANRTQRMKRSVTATLGAVMLAAAPAGLAQAQQAAPQESAWIKVCNTDPNNNQEVCVTRQELRTDSGTFISSLTLQQIPEQNNQYGLGVLLPVGVFLPPGVGIMVDGQERAKAQFTLCLPNPPICIAEALINNDVINAMKRGGKLTLAATNAQRRAVNIDMTLMGFTRAFDGPGVDAETAQAQQQELNQALQRRAEEARQRLIEQQQRPPGGG